MRLTAIFVSAVLLVGLACAQDPAPVAKPADASSPKADPKEPLEAEIIHVKTLTGDSFQRLVSLLGVFGVTTRSDEQLRTIVVYAPKEVVAQMRRIVAELDTPGSEAAIGRNFEMTMSLLRATTKAPTAGNQLPDEIEAVARQLRASTQYKDIQLWDVVPLRLQEGKITTEDMQLPALNSGSSSDSMEPASALTIQIRPEAATRKGQAWSVRFSEFNLSFRVPTMTGSFQDSAGKSLPQFSYQNIGLKTSGDFLEGQKTVLGKVSGTGNNSAIFVVISLKVL